MSMKPQALCAWLGRTDIRASEGVREIGSGPILGALNAGTYSALSLLSNYSQGETGHYLSWLRERYPALEIELRMVDLSSPTEFAEIYESAVDMLADFKASHPDYDLSFHLSPGTPAMAATWILIASGKYKAQLIETSREKGVQRVHLPFEILAEYHPKYGRRIDSQILGISDEMLPETPAFDSIIHSSEVMKHTVNMARRVSFFDVPVLLLGESGTGKELFARAIHTSSQRADGPFISVNCGALPESLVESELFGYAKGAFTGATTDKKGYIESADGGTLFLDEIGELPPHVQVLLLRVLQDGSFQRIGNTKIITSDFRLISATNRPLTGAEEVRKADGHSFRDDLFHRIAVGVIKLPPLRARERDLQLLTDHFLAILNDEFSSVESYRKKSLSVEARKVINAYPWPGNVRELINTLTRACLWCAGKTIDAAVVEQSLVYRSRNTEEPNGARQNRDGLLGRRLGKGFDIQELIDEVKRNYLSRAMNEAGGSKVKAAKLLGMSNYQTLSNWLDKYGIDYENNSSE